LTTRPTLPDVSDTSLSNKATALAPSLTQDQIQKLRTQAQQKDWRALAAFPHALTQDQIHKLRTQSQQSDRRALAVFPHGLNDKAAREWENFILKQELQHTRELLYASYGLSREQWSLLEQMYRAPLTTIRVLVGRTALIDLHAFMPVRSIRDLAYDDLSESHRFLYCADTETQIREDAYSPYTVKILHWPDSKVCVKKL